MCNKPLLINGYEVACRDCDECCATYKNGWVARAMAERSCWPHAAAFTLTYAPNEDGSDPLGAKVFRYKDVQDMWKRLRSAAARKIKRGEWSGVFVLRYIIVGEIGTKFGRVHYHGVWFASHDLRELGVWSHPRIRGFAHNERMNWTMWGNGFVEFQRATRKSVSYTLKYILKSRMTEAKSKGNAR